MSLTNSGLSPISYDKGGANYSARETDELCIKMINSEQYFERRGKEMGKDIDNATALVESAIENFDKTLQRMIDAEVKITNVTKKTTGKIRDTSQKLSDGLASIEKLANFDRLGRYVELLERAEKSLSSLAVLEENGKLEKIAKAIR